VDAPSLFSDREAAFLEALVDEGVDFLVVGLAAAMLQGAPAVTQDVGLWVGDLPGPRFLEALRKTGATYIPPTASSPPLLAGPGTELFDLVVHMHGLGAFHEEATRALHVRVGRVEVPVLPLARIIASKKATGRPKDLAILPALEDALRIQRRGAAVPDADWTP
jgi:hypothetical protein